LGPSVVILQAPLVAPDPLFQLFEAVGEGAVGVAALAGGDEALARGEADPAVDLEAVAVLGHHDLGVLRPSFEIFSDPVFKFLGDARA